LWVRVPPSPLLLGESQCNEFDVPNVVKKLSSGICSTLGSGLFILWTSFIRMMYSSLVDDLMHFKKFAMDSDFENNEFRQWEIKELKELEANLREKGMEEQANKLNGVLCSMVD